MHALIDCLLGAHIVGYCFQTLLVKVNFYVTHYMGTLVMWSRCVSGKLVILSSILGLEEEIFQFKKKLHTYLLACTS